MKKLIGVLVAGTVLGLSQLAMAEEVAGVIAQVDPATGTLILEDGSQFIAASGVSLDGLEPGTEVTVTFEEQGGQMTATEVKPAG